MENVLNPLADKIIKSAPLLPLENASMREAKEELIRSLIIDTDTEVEQDIPAITIDGVGGIMLQNITSVKAKQKQGKTTAITAIVSALLAGECFRLRSSLEDATVLWVDTEQSDYDSKCIVERVCMLTDLPNDYINEHLKVINVRRFSNSERFDFLTAAISLFHPQVVVIDGVVDLIEDFNDLSSSKHLVAELLRISSENHLAIIAVLHTNKGASDHEMRGHIGTFLAQKSCNIFECEKDENIIRVKCTDSRHAPVPEWALRYDEDGNVCEGDLAYAELQAKRQMEKDMKKSSIEAERKTVLFGILTENGGRMSRRELIDEGMKKLGKSYGTVSSLVTNMKNVGELLEMDGCISICNNK